MAKSMKLGGGGRFAKLKGQLSSEPGVTDPGALAASIGRKKLGKSEFQNLAVKGKERESTKGTSLAKALQSK